MNSLLEWDVSLFLAINGRAGSWLDYLFAWPSFLGENYIYLPLVFFFMLVWDPSGKLLKRFAFIAACVLIAGLINRILKVNINRPRPYAYFYEAIDQGKVVVNYLFSMNTARSFPSGHAVSMFSLALALHYIYGTRLWFVYLVAAWVGFSRIYTGAHFPADVLAGALVGIASSLAVIFALKGIKKAAGFARGF